MEPIFEGEQGVAYCESKRYHFAAARLAEKLAKNDCNMHRRAANNYMKANKMLSAARVFARMGDRNSAHNVYMAAVKERLDKGDYVGAARIEREIGNERSAAQLYARAIEESAKGTEHWKTAMIAEEAGLNLEARVFRNRAIEAEKAPEMF
ncbi:MAG: hypothetical protein QME12_00955 [Nanoarchaeota archaeon]|nr:hypothetical protein [Nanoarchaeota archaeon]